MISKALIIVDMQYDVCEGGPLAHEDSLKIIPKINSIRDEYELVIFSIKSHPKNHSSFKQYGGDNPKNCVLNTYGSKIHDDLIINSKDILICRETLQKYSSDSVFFEAEEIERTTNLKNILSSHNIKDIHFCGNGIDSFIFRSVLDAQIYKFNCYIIKDGFSYMNKDKAEQCIKFMEMNRVLFI